MNTLGTVEAQLHGPGSRWKTATLIETTDTFVRVLRDGKFYTLAPECVRARIRKSNYKEG